MSEIPTKTKPVERQHRMFERDLNRLLKKHGNIPADEMLALTSQLVGKLIALQDQRKYTPDMAMLVVSANIDAGNKAILSDLLKTEGTA